MLRLSPRRQLRASPRGTTRPFPPQAQDRGLATIKPSHPMLLHTGRSPGVPAEIWRYGSPEEREHAAYDHVYGRD